MAKLSQQQRGSFLSRTQRQVQLSEDQRARAKAQKEFEELKARAETTSEELQKAKTIEEYGQRYSLLDPELKPFFQTPETLKATQTQRIEQSKTQVQEKINSLQQRIVDARQRYDQNIQKADAWYVKQKQKTNDPAKREKIKESYKEKLRENEYDYEERVAQFKGEIRGLDEGLQKLNKGEDLSYSDIYSYAGEIGSYEQAREEARSKGTEYKTQKKLQISKLEAQGYVPQLIEFSQKGQPKTASVEFYNPKTQTYAPSIEGLSFDIKGKVQVEGLKQLGYTQPISRTIDLYGKKVNFQTRLPYFESKKGTITTAYEDTGKTIDQLQAQSILAERGTVQDVAPETISNRMRSVEVDYDQLVKDAYKEKQKGITVKESWGDAVKGFSWKDITQAGSYSDWRRFGGVNAGQQIINLNKLFGFKKDQTLAHEVGHSLASDYQGDLDIFKESSGTGLLGNVGYSKDRVSEEYLSRSFSKYIQDPTGFQTKFPKQAEVFEGLLGVDELKEITRVTNVSPTQLNLTAQQSTIKNKKGEFNIPTTREVFDYLVGKAQDIPETNLAKRITQVPSASDYFMKYVPPKVPSGFNWARERVHFDFGTTKQQKYVGGLITLPQLNVITFGKLDKPTLQESGRIEAQKWLSTQSTNILEGTIGKEKVEAFKEEELQKAQEKYQESFEDTYLSSIAEGDLTFKEAEKEFIKSDEAKRINQEYQTSFNKGYLDLQRGFNLKTKATKGVALTGITLAQLGFELSKDPLTAVTTVGTVAVGSSALTYVPKGLLYGTTAGFGVYGTYKFLSPTSTLEEAGSGLVTAVISAGTLGYAGYRYLKAPIPERIIIKAPKTTLRSASTVGRDIKYVSKEETINKVLYPKQRILQTSTQGYRTTVTTKWRSLSNKLLRTNFKNIYEGIPTQQLSKTYSLHIGKMNVGSYTTKSGYEKAYSLLTKYGVSPKDAVATLQYTAPKVYEQTFEGVLEIKGTRAEGIFKSVTKQPVLTVDKTLGIKTRGARDIVEMQKVVRQIKGNAVFEYKQTLTGYPKGQGYVGTSYDRSLNILKGKSIIKDYFGVKYKDILGVSRRLTTGVPDFTVGRTQLYNKVVDLSKDTIIFKDTSFKKTPWSKTFTKPSTQTKPYFTFEVEPQHSQVNKVKSLIKEYVITPSSVERSKYWGTGMYEKTSGAGIFPTQTQTASMDLKNILKQVSIPSPKISPIKDTFQPTAVRVGLNQNTLVANLLASSVLDRSKAKVKPMNVILLKDILQEKQVLKVAQLPALKTGSSLNSQLKQITGLETPTVIVTPPITEPTITDPIIQPPSPIPTIIPWLNPFDQRRKKKKGKRDLFTKLYLPDFTSRALGLKAETLTGKQAQSRIKKLLTGFELRRGVIVK